jgi:hypothetical protein
MRTNPRASPRRSRQTDIDTIGATGHRRLQTGIGASAPGGPSAEAIQQAAPTIATTCLVGLIFSIKALKLVAQPHKPGWRNFWMIAAADPPSAERVSVRMEADKGTQMSITVQKTIPAARMHQFHQMVERWLQEGPIRLATNATITAMDNAAIPKEEQAAIIEDRDIIMKHNMRLGLISEVFAAAIETAVKSSRSGREAQDEIARLIVTAIGLRQDDDSELVTFTFATQAEADAFNASV